MTSPLAVATLSVPIYTHMHGIKQDHLGSDADGVIRKKHFRQPVMEVIQAYGKAFNPHPPRKTKKQTKKSGN